MLVDHHKSLANSLYQGVTMRNFVILLSYVVLMIDSCTHGVSFVVLIMLFTALKTFLPKSSIFRR